LSNLEEPRLEEEELEMGRMEVMARR